MDENFFWNVFTNTGSVESYLAYKSLENPQDDANNNEDNNDK